jgi:hypothetical protein
MPLMESSIYGLWVAKQSAKGTVASTAIKQLRQVGGDISANREDGSEPFSNQSRFLNYSDFVDSVSGAGDPQVQVTPNDIGYLCYLFFGSEVVTGASDPYTHTFTPNANGGFWSTWWTRKGGSVIQRQRHADMRIASLQIEGSTGQKILRATPTLLGLDPAETIAADPSGVNQTTQAPLLYTEAEGAFTIDGSVFRGQSQFSVTWDEALSLISSDSVLPYDLVMGQPTITVTVTIYLDSNGLASYNNLVYGSATPTAGTKPLKYLPANGSYVAEFKSRNAAGLLTPARELKIDLPSVKWTPDVAIPVNPDGGATEINLTGQVRVGAPMSTVTVKNSDAAYV